MIMHFFFLKQRVWKGSGASQREAPSHQQFFGHIIMLSVIEKKDIHSKRPTKIFLIGSQRVF
jgi:hypothetical protein